MKTVKQQRKQLAKLLKKGCPYPDGLMFCLGVKKKRLDYLLAPRSGKYYEMTKVKNGEIY